MDPPTPPVDHTQPPVDFDDWQFDEDLSQARHLADAVKGRGGATFQGSPSEPPLDPSMQAVADWHVHLKNPAAMPNASFARRRPAARRSRRAPVLPWMVLSLGLAAFVCGAVLLGWSLATGRSDLWTWGIPLVVVGQAGLIVGLVLQMDGLWQTHHHTAQTLDELDERICDLKHSTTLMTTTHSSSAQSFYSHLAEGAGPHLLLADLKGQLDLLARTMANQRP